MTELSEILDLLGGHLVVLSPLGDLLESFLATIIIVLEQLILSIILEGNE